MSVTLTAELAAGRERAGARALTDLSARPRLAPRR
jgi:hypothetical protein